MKKTYTIAFFGSSENSLVVLKSLLASGYSIRLAVTAPPRPQGRLQKLTKTLVHEYSESSQIPVYTPEKLDAETVRLIKKKFRNLSEKIGVSVVADYSIKIPFEIINLPQHGSLNLHPSLLPLYRGSTPAQAAILNGDKITGLTIIKMDEHFDHGPIVSQFKEEIRQDDTSESLYARLFSLGANVLVNILPAWIEDRIVPREQNHSLATYAYRLTREDGFIPWVLIRKAINGQSLPITKLQPRFRQAIKENEKKGNSLLTPYSSRLIERAVRAFHPWPGVWTKVRTNKGIKRMKILQVELKNKSLVLIRVQLEGQTPKKLTEQDIEQL